MTITLFSNNCPRCVILKHKLEREDIPFTITDDFTELREQGFMSVPILKVNGKYLTYEFAHAWVQEEMNKYTEKCINMQKIGELDV